MPLIPDAATIQKSRRDAPRREINIWRDGDRRWRNYRKAAAPQAGRSGSCQGRNTNRQDF